MLKAGLTGGIGSGKSSAARLFSDWGCPTLDLDVVAREVTAAGSPALARIVARFGDGMLRPDGSLDRALLASVVFHNPEDRRRLEEIVHPAIREAVAAWIDEQSHRESPPPVVMLEIPLLFESKLESTVDRIVLVSADPETRIKRLAAGRGMAEADASARIAAQMPDSVKRERSHFVIDNNGTPEQLREQVERVWNQLLAAARA